MRTHIGADADSGLARTVVDTPANEAYIEVANELQYERSAQRRLTLSLENQATTCPRERGNSNSATGLPPRPFQPN
jgi:hypothetical protein